MTFPGWNDSHHRDAVCPRCGAKETARLYDAGWNPGQEKNLGWHMMAHVSPQGHECGDNFDFPLCFTTLDDCIAKLEALEKILAE